MGMREIAGIRSAHPSLLGCIRSDGYFPSFNLRQ